MPPSSVREVMMTPAQTTPAKMAVSALWWTIGGTTLGWQAGAQANPCERRYHTTRSEETSRTEMRGRGSQGERHGQRWVGRGHQKRHAKEISTHGPGPRSGPR